MKKLSRDKRNQLITVVAIILATLGLIYFFLIRPQYASLAQIAAGKKNADNKLLGIKNTITNATSVAGDLAQAIKILNQTEGDMASGDLYSWTYDTMRRFKQSYQVDIPEIGHPTIGDVDLLPDFPYKQIRFSLAGTAYYHDLGKFIANFENDFPHMRMVNLIVEPSSGVDGSNEKLSFRMDVIALVKPNLS